MMQMNPFLRKRRDDQNYVLENLRYIPASSWPIRPQFSYTNNNSNIDLYGYERKVISFNVRKDFSW